MFFTAKKEKTVHTWLPLFIHALVFSCGYGICRQMDDPNNTKSVSVRNLLQKISYVQYPKRKKVSKQCPPNILPLVTVPTSNISATVITSFFRGTKVFLRRWDIPLCSTLPSQEGGDVKKKDAIFQPGEGRGDHLSSQHRGRRMDPQSHCSSYYYTTASFPFLWRWFKWASRGEKHRHWFGVRVISSYSSPFFCIIAHLIKYKSWKCFWIKC